MTTIALLICAVVVLCIALIRVLWRSPLTIDAQAERASRPEALLDAKLVYMEKLFRVSSPVGLVAKLDRAYRMPSGLIVLVEFKSRWINRPFMSDVIQLSVQRMAVQGETGQAVASYGYVVVKAPSKRAPQTAYFVELMSDAEVIALVRRREELLARQIAPRYSMSQKMCRKCAFRLQCDHPSSLEGKQR